MSVKSYLKSLKRQIKPCCAYIIRNPSLNQMRNEKTAPLVPFLQTLHTLFKT